MEIINQAEPQFRYLQDTICEPLFAMLREINEVERNTVAPNFADFAASLQNIVSGKCTAKLLAKGYGNCIHKPPKYRWVDTEDCVVIFRMDKPKRATVEASFKVGTLDAKDRFTLIKQGEEWLVDAFNYWSTYDEIWHRGGI